MRQGKMGTRFEGQTQEAGITSELRASSHRAQSMISILLIDDDSSLLKAVSGMLQLWVRNVSVKTCHSGLEALGYLEANQCHAVVTDISMPGIDGLMLLRRVKRQWPDISVVLMTGNHDPALASRALSEGAAGFILKPFAREDFVEAIQRVLDHQKIG